MFINGKAYLYLSSNKYELLEFDCAYFQSVINVFSSEGTIRKVITKVYIPLNDDFDVLVNPKTDYVMVSNKPIIAPIKATIDDKGNITNPSELLRNGAKIVTLSTKNNYGSKNMQHYYLEVQ